MEHEVPIYGYENTVKELNALLTTCPPSFMYINDPITPRISASIVRSLLSQVKGECSLHSYCATVDAAACFTPRLLYDTVINAVADWTPEWDSGCNNWVGPSDAQTSRDSSSFDGFISALRSFWHITTQYHRNPNTAQNQPRLIICIEHAERLKDNMPDLIVPLTRLSELVRFDACVIMHSNVHWELIRPPMGASPDPYYLSVPSLSREAVISRLEALYPSSVPVAQPTDIDPNTYHPNFKQLYHTFLDALYGVCALYTKDPDELAYIAAARWPGFVQPVIDEHKQRIDALRAERLQAESEQDYDIDVDDEDMNTTELELRSPDPQTTLRLIRLFRDSTGRALEHLYPRRTSALAWAHANAPPAHLLSVPARELSTVPARLPEEASRGAAPLKELPRMAKFVLVAAFLASTNPARTDMRMFGRGPDERKKRRRKTASPRKATKSTAVKIPQRLVGPMPFPLDRMLAILGVLLEENDADSRPPAPEYELPGEYTEMEISRVAVYAQVMELTSMHLLHRTSPADRLDMSPVFKCGIGYDAALSLARDVGVALNDLMWEPL